MITMGSDPNCTIWFS